MSAPPFFLEKIMAESLYGWHSRSPSPPRIAGHDLPDSARNQCDGCQAGIPVDDRGLHRMGKGTYPDYMACQKEKYRPAP